MRTAALTCAIGMAAAAVPHASLARSPCPPPPANALLSPQNASALSDADQAAAQTAASQPLPWYQITVGSQVTSSIPKLSLPDFVTETSAALNNPNGLGNGQLDQDFSEALTVYYHATDQDQCTSFPVGSRPVSTGSSATPVRHMEIAVLMNSCKVTTFDQYKTYLRQIGPSLDFNTKLELLSMLGSKLDTLYNSKQMSTSTPLPAVFQALINNAQAAGVCRDIHEFLAITAASLGLQDAGTTGADWNDYGVTGAHDVAQFKDPQTGKYIFVNYGNVYYTDSKYVSEASQQISEGLSAYTSSVQVETGSDSANPKLHQMLSPRTQAIQSAIDQGSDMSRPHLQFSVGNNLVSASAQAKLVGGDKNRVGVFAVAVDNLQGDPVQMEAAGARVDGGASTQLSKNTTLSANANVKAGVLNVGDDGIQGVSSRRNEVAKFASGQAETDFGWNGNGNSGKVGVQVVGQDAVYFKGGLGVGNTPYDTLNIIAVDNPSKSIQVHFTDSGFISSRTTQDIRSTYHHADDALGLKVTHPLGSRVTATNDFTIHDFNGQALGVHNDSWVTYHTYRHGDFSLGADVAYVKNRSSDDFYDYPLTCSIMAQYARQIGHYYLNAGGKYNCNRHNDFTLMQQDSSLAASLANPGWLIEQPTFSGEFTLSW